MFLMRIKEKKIETSYLGYGDLKWKFMMIVQLSGLDNVDNSGFCFIDGKKELFFTLSVPKTIFDKFNVNDVLAEF